MDQHELSRKEQRELRRQQKRAARETSARKEKAKKFASWSIGFALVALIAGGLIWYAIARPPLPESEYISRSGIHWHAQLAIYVQGEKQRIPPNIGIGTIHKPVHTHDEDSDQGVIHLEFPGAVQPQDVMLGEFFKNWGKDMHSFGTLISMKVNGEEHSAYEQYVMQDEDVIELRYE